MFNSFIKAFSVLPLLFLAFTSTAQIAPLGGCVVTFEIGDDVTICSSSSIYILPEGSPSGGSYSGLGIMDDFFFPSIAGPGQHIITYNYDNGFCIGSASDTINVVLPIAIDVSGDMELCFGESTTITALNGQDIEWESGSMELSETFTPEETSYYIVSGYDENGCLTAGDFSIVVHELPDVIFEGDTSICIGESTVIVATGAASYLWNSGDEIDFISVSPAIESTYGITATSEFGCVSESEVTVTVHDYPEVEIFGETEICAFEPTLLFVNGGDSYEWNTGALSTSIEVFPATNSSYSVVATNIHGCETSDAYDLIVNPLPQITIQGDALICTGSSTTLVAEGALTYVWTEGPSTSEFIVTPAESMTFTVAGTDELGCVNLSSFFVEFHPVVQATSELLNTGLICTGDTIQLQMPGFTDSQWSFDGSLWSMSDTLTFLAMNEFTHVEFVGNDANGCTSAMGNYDIIANTTPTLIAAGDTEICAGEVTLIFLEGAESYLWSTGSTFNPYGLSLLETDTFEVVGTAMNGCTALLELQIVVNELPNVTIEGNPHVCAGESTALTANGALTYAWSNGSDDQQVLVSPVLDQSISVQGMTEQGCLGGATIELVVDSIPLITTDSYPVICPGASMLLTAFGAVSYAWSTGSQMQTTEIAPLLSSEYSVIGTDGNGCSDTAFVNIEVFDPVELFVTIENDTVCDLSEPLFLTASPSGGFFSGEWVSGDVFTPSINAWGNNDVIYAYTDENECYSEIVESIFVDDCTLLQEESFMQIQAIPNPFTENLNVTSTAIIQDVMIYQFDGKMVSSFSAIQNYSAAFNLTSLATGCYFVSVKHQNGSVITQRIVKE